MLDIFQQDASVNTLFVATFTYGRGIAGRQVPGQPLPDHGKQEYDTTRSRAAATPFIRSITGHRLQGFPRARFRRLRRAEAVLPAARKRGMKTICWFEDVWRKTSRTSRKRRRRASTGRTPRRCASTIRTTATGCWARWRTTRSYEIDGIMWGSERQGAFANALGASTAATRESAQRTCFCQFCEAQGARSAASTRRGRGRLSGAGRVSWRPAAQGQAAGGRLLRRTCGG